jgi:phage N-6-adenine-methyltransferase
MDRRDARPQQLAEPKLMLNTGMMSSDRGDWSTPQGLFDSLDSVFHFKLDAAATAGDTKCPIFNTQALNGAWPQGPAFLNPPYGTGIGRFVHRAWVEWKYNRQTVVCLLPARTDTKWWQDCWDARYIVFIRGRLKFGGQEGSAPFPSAIVVFSDQDWIMMEFERLGRIIRP